ncbi:PI-PLC X domain-containing protein 1 [Sardina pilchardus]|uniref:PI-PLC X domain-containing protein 1 n=1 Tax=Sardina pilchardus TaxID=27697 RepID=UPI002E129BA5
MERGSNMPDETNCADWMSHLPDKLWKVPLWNLAIPGSHDTMTYHLDDRSPVVQSASCLLRMLDHCFPCFIRPYVKRWATTQTWDISDQLDAGIRFLDLRVAHKRQDDNDHFYFAHGIYSKQTLKDTVTNVAQWLREHPKEVVIIACSAFDDMNKEEHLELINFLKRRFEKKLCPKTETPSLSLCWEYGYQVILSYDNPAAEKYTDFWPMIDYWWANTPDPKDLILFLEGQKEDGRPKESFFVAGMNLTEDLRYIVQHPCQTMRSMTLRAYNFLLDWVKKQHPGPSKRSLNIICADFVADNEFVHIVIALNKQILS